MNPHLSQLASLQHTVLTFLEKQGAREIVSDGRPLLGCNLIVGH